MNDPITNRRDMFEDAASERKVGNPSRTAFGGVMLQPLYDQMGKVSEFLCFALKNVLPGTVDPILGALWRARIEELPKVGGA